MALWGTAAHGDELQTLMDRMQLRGAVQLSYEETRWLELMTEPWHGRGFLLTAEPDSLVKLQLQPHREIMATFGKHMFYYDAERDLRHRAKMGSGSAMELQVAAFQAIATGDFAGLKPYYTISLEDDRSRWRMALTPKPGHTDLAHITVEGAQGAAADRIVLEQTDGDRMELTVEKTDEGDHLKATISRLLLEAAGE